MAIGDRIKEAIDNLAKGNPINSLIQVSIAIDGTGKKAYRQETTSYRWKRFIRANQAFITRVAFGKLEIQGPILFNMADGDKNLEQVLYKLVRCNLLHEGNLSDLIKIVKEAEFGMTEDGKVIISEKLIWAMIFAVIGAQVNRRETLPEAYTASIGKTVLKLNNLWGKKEEIYELVLLHNK